MSIFLLIVALAVILLLAVGIAENKGSSPITIFKAGVKALKEAIRVKP